MRYDSRSGFQRAINRINERTNQNLTLAVWSPGDGWSRYRLENDRGQAVSDYYRLREFDAYLVGLSDMIYTLWPMIQAAPNGDQ